VYRERRGLGGKRRGERVVRQAKPFFDDRSEILTKYVELKRRLKKTLGYKVD
jgi:hypothetical protein